MNNYEEEDEDEIWVQKYPKRIASTGTYTSTATSGQSVNDVFGDRSDFNEIFEKRDKKVMTCRICDIDFSSKFHTCPICGKRLTNK
jgi:hypothetical protein